MTVWKRRAAHWDFSAGSVWREYHIWIASSDDSGATTIQTSAAWPIAPMAPANTVDIAKLEGSTVFQDRLVILIQHYRAESRPQYRLRPSVLFYWLQDMAKDSSYIAVDTYNLQSWHSDPYQFWHCTPSLYSIQVSNISPFYTKIILKCKPRTCSSI